VAWFDSAQIVVAAVVALSVSDRYTRAVEWAVGYRIRIDTARDWYL